MNDNDMSLKEICEMLNVSRRVIQGYEKVDLIKATGKNKYGYLLYNKDAVDRITRIRFYQKIGFQLKEIKEFIDTPENHIREILKEKQIYLHNKVKHLNEIQSILSKMIINISSNKLNEEILQVIKEEI